MSESTSKQVRAVGYCRVAVTGEYDQVEKLQIQKQQINEAAKRLNFEIVQIFEQIGHEPASFPYSELSEVLGYCESDPNIKFLVVTKPDRISRSIKEFYFWKISFERIGVTIKYADDIEIDSPMSDFVEKLHIMMGQLEHERLSERVKRGIQAKKAQEA